jgi:hypothetical protein
MLDPDFWKNLDNRLMVYSQMLKEISKEESPSIKNQYKSERQQYEDKLTRFFQMKRFYDSFYFQHSP